MSETVTVESAEAGGKKLRMVEMERVSVVVSVIGGGGRTVRVEMEEKACSVTVRV